MAAKNGRTTIKIDPEVLSNAKRDAEQAGLTLSAFIERVLRRQRTGGETTTTPREINLPSFSGGDALIDLTPEAIKEILNEEDIQRYLRIERQAEERRHKE